eukprot:g824.t1
MCVSRAIRALLLHALIQLCAGREAERADATICINTPAKGDSDCSVQQIGFICICNCGMQEVFLPNLHDCSQCSIESCAKKFSVCANATHTPFCKVQYSLCQTLKFNQVEDSCYNFNSTVGPNNTMVNLSVVLNCGNDGSGAWTASVGKTCQDQLQVLSGHPGQCEWKSIAIDRIIPVNGSDIIHLQAHLNVTLQVVCVYGMDQTQIG